MIAALLLLPAIYIIILPITSPVIGGAVAVLITAVVEVLLVVTSPVVAVGTVSWSPAQRGSRSA